MAAPVERQGGPPHAPPEGRQGEPFVAVTIPGREKEEEWSQSEMTEALGVFSWLRELQVHPRAEFTIRAFLALHMRREVVAMEADDMEADDIGPVDGRPVAANAVEGEEDSPNEPSFARGMSVASSRLQELYEEQALAKLKALARISTSEPSSNDVCEHLQAQVLQRYLTQIETIVQCGST